jgi:hypothetical protein
MEFVFVFCLFDVVRSSGSAVGIRASYSSSPGKTKHFQRPPSHLSNGYRFSALSDNSYSSGLYCIINITSKP